MTWGKRVILPNLMICTGCGILFRVVRMERPYGSYDGIDCPCGHIIYRGDDAGFYEVEAVEAAVEYEWN